MKIKCEYCDAMVEETCEKCPHCGALLPGVNRNSAEQPQTIEDLKAWYVAHNLPPEETTRFFIGKNIWEAKAFGIYKTPNGECVVYKNKANGERAIRYQGADEAYAVNELYQRLRAEIVDQKARNGNGSGGGKKAADKKASDKKSKTLGCGCLTILLAIILFGVFAGSDGVPNGYYRYDNTEYYSQNGRWYRYDNQNNTWLEAENSDKLSESITEDNAGQYSYSDHQGTKFEETNWYDAGDSDDDGDWDNDNSWSDDDDWSSSSTDWDSDW